MSESTVKTVEKKSKQIPKQILENNVVKLGTVISCLAMVATMTWKAAVISHKVDTAVTDRYTGNDALKDQEIQNLRDQLQNQEIEHNRSVNDTQNTYIETIMEQSKTAMQQNGEILSILVDMVKEKTSGN